MLLGLYQRGLLVNTEQPAVWLQQRQNNFQNLLRSSKWNEAGQRTIHRVNIYLSHGVTNQQDGTNTH